MKIKRSLLSCLTVLSLASAHAQGTVPNFIHTIGQSHYMLAGNDPEQGITTTIPTVLVPLRLTFASKIINGKPFVMDAAEDVEDLLRSPVFTNFPFTEQGPTQYADAMLRATFPAALTWHTLLGHPELKPLTIAIPAGYGYMLTSKKEGRSFAVVDVEFLQKELFKQIPKQPGKLVLAVAHNTTWYGDEDATECCTWGTHGVDTATGNSFVLSSYLKDAPSVVTGRDVQPLTQQLSEFINDPLHDPLLRGTHSNAPGNRVPSWTRLAGVDGGDQGPCGGTTIATPYWLLEPTDTNPKNNFPASKAFVAAADSRSWHLQNAALLSWYTGASNGLGSTYSFPDSNVLTTPAQRCEPRPEKPTVGMDDPPLPKVAAVPLQGKPNGHQLIGYWVGYGDAGENFALHEVSPQWDVIIVAFATPAKNAPEGTMQFQSPAGLRADEFKADIVNLKKQGKKVMISLGGGGENFTLADPKRVPNYVSTVTQIVTEYGFDGIDIDFESPSLSIAPGDTDFRHPTTPSIVNLISALRQLHDHFGPKFMISLVPEGTQIPAGYPSYGGQFGSYLAITWAIRDILSFIDVQSYNTPPLQALDGEIYQPGTVDYHAAMTELLLHGFNVGGDPKYFFPPLPADKVAVGFLTGDATPPVVSQAMDYLITGKPPTGTTYKLQQPGGYPAMLGAMFWNINDDRHGSYNFSNLIGPQLHRYPAVK
jgi:chitinase